MVSDQGTYDTHAAKEISLDSVTRIMQNLGVSNLYVKQLAPNDNSKNQPYFGSHLTDMPFIPTGEITASPTDSMKTSKTKIKFQAVLDLSWVDAEGTAYPAPHSKLIYYPQYPEVRFSGFLLGSKVNASKWMDPKKQGRSEGRWLILGVAKDTSVYAYLVTPECKLSRELAHASYVEVSKTFWQLNILHNASKKSTRDALLQKLLGIHQLGWIRSQKLNSNMEFKNYQAANGGGYTLEAMLGIPPNGISEPDYLGWEVKQFGVKSFPKTSARLTTLMTPEPDGGYYKSSGVKEFVRTYGYADISGKPDRMNFGGKHIVDLCHARTNLTMKLVGFDTLTCSITDASGSIVLLDYAGNFTASWSFAKLMDHWKRKHAQAVYIPCMRRTQSGGHEYYYGKDIELGTGTDFEKFLSAMSLGVVYYDPGIKLENASTDNSTIKRRSQFRVNHRDLNTLYKKYEFVEMLS